MKGKRNRPPLSLFLNTPLHIHLHIHPQHQHQHHHNHALCTTSPFSLLTLPLLASPSSSAEPESVTCCCLEATAVDVDAARNKRTAATIPKRNANQGRMARRRTVWREGKRGKKGALVDLLDRETVYVCVCVRLDLDMKSGMEVWAWARRNEDAVKWPAIQSGKSEERKNPRDPGMPPPPA
jgi:hypothetical protein